MEPWFFALLFTALWLGICTLLSRLGGWARLAASFRAKHPPSGERFRFVSGSMGAGRLPVSYRSSLDVVVGRRGLHLAVFFPFRFQSPPLFIPWVEVASVTEKPFLRTFGVAIHLRRPGPIIAIRGRAGHSIRAAHAAASSARAP